MFVESAEDDIAVISDVTWTAQKTVQKQYKK